VLSLLKISGKQNDESKEKIAKRVQIERGERTCFNFAVKIKVCLPKIVKKRKTTFSKKFNSIVLNLKCLLFWDDKTFLAFLEI